MSASKIVVAESKKRKVREEDTEDECADLDRRSSEIRTKRRRVRINQAMQRHDKLVNDLWEKMKGLGWTKERIDGPADDGPKSKRQKAKELWRESSQCLKDAKLEEFKADIAGEIEDDFGVVELVDPIEGTQKVLTLHSLSLGDLRDKIVSQVGSPVLSKANLRALVSQDEIGPKLQCSVMSS